MLKRIVTSIIVSLAILLALTITVALRSPVQAAGVNGNPWNYSFNATGGKLIILPPTAFCSYFHCIPNFPRGKGYVEECRDGMFSLSGGRRGSCSYHGGDWRALYAHVSVAQEKPSQSVTSEGSSTTSPGLPYTGSDPYAH